MRGEGVVDTRLLEKPESFDGTTDNWRQFKFTFLGYAGAIDSRLKKALIESERQASLNAVVLHVGTALGRVQRNAC